MQHNEERIAYLMALNEFPGFGPRRMRQLLKRFGSPKDAFLARAQELMHAGIPEQVALSFCTERSHINPKDILQHVRKHAIDVIPFDDPRYPKLLQEIHDPPPLLYCKGMCPDWSSAPALAMVGARKASPYGKRCAHMLASDLARSGVILVSGLAFGIDEVVHRSTVQEQGVTVAVLGFGILHTPTAREQDVIQTILRHNGAIISEFPLFYPALKQNFPIRNRIIAGMSCATLIVEAAEKSGSLITARLAIEQNRDVFALPGHITHPLAQGTNALLKDGAHMVTCAQDILDVLQLTVVEQHAKQARINATQEEEILLNFLSQEPMHIDDVVRVSACTCADVARLLSMLELKGLVQNVGAQYYTVV